MIIKLQRPLAQSDGGAPVWLAYPEGREPKWLMPEADIPAAAIAAMGRESKAYYEATVGDDLKLVIGRRVRDQPW